MTNDLGESWEIDSSLIIYNHQQKQREHTKDIAEHLVQMGTWSYGLANGIKLANGNVLVNYYAGNGISTDICWALLKII